MKASLFNRFFAYMDTRLPSDRLLIYIALLVFIGAGVFTLLSLNKSHTITIPKSGGVLEEGIIGAPRFVNPVLAITRADHDLVSLLYTGLVKLSPEDQLTLDLAQSITISEDGLTYNVILREDQIFHDGSSVRAEDIAYTIALIQDPDLKSPLRGNWNGVTIEVLSEYELNIVLETPYAPFMENLTVGILPKHIWGSLSIEELPFSQYNTEPVGSGPYTLAKVTRTDAGLINTYELQAFKSAETPNIARIIFSFYQNEDGLLTALTEGDIKSTVALSYESLNSLNKDEYVFAESPLPRVFSVFFNQNKSASLREQSVRNALNAVIDRNVLIAEVLNGYGTPTESPVPPSFLTLQSTNTETRATSTKEERLKKAQDILTQGGWENHEGTWTKEIDEVETTLQITLATANTPVFEQTAAYLETVWKELGVDVRTELYEQNDLVQAIIRPRNYQALLFGNDVGRVLDFYPFWHSSQREDPGLNVALYTNLTADAALETARTTREETEYLDAITTFIAEIKNDTPALFLYSPSFVYVHEKTIQTSMFKHIARTSERFSNIASWHIAEESVWPVFAE